MTRIFASAAIASAALLGATLASGVAAQASDISDRSQLEASVGITPAEGQSLTLTDSPRSSTARRARTTR